MNQNISEMTKDKKNFWERKKLEEMTHLEWESLCDNCARCCLHKIEDPDSLAIKFTDVACKLLDVDSCRCTDYQNRQEKVSACLYLQADNPAAYRFLPDTCAYRKLYEGKPLEHWHPLVSGSSSTVHEAGISVQHNCVSETYIHPNEISLREAGWIECSPLIKES